MLLHNREKRGNKRENRRGAEGREGISEEQREERV
jgi:hypothetical protein